jgi:hypothetical protein
MILIVFLTTHASRAVVGHLSYFDMNTNFS